MFDCPENCSGKGPDADMCIDCYRRKEKGVAMLIDDSIQKPAAEKINALKITVEQKYDMLEQFIEDCNEYSVETANEKLATAIQEVNEDNNKGTES